MAPIPGAFEFVDTKCYTIQLPNMSFSPFTGNPMRERDRERERERRGGRGEKGLLCQFTRPTGSTILVYVASAWFHFFIKTIYEEFIDLVKHQFIYNQITQNKNYKVNQSTTTEVIYSWVYVCMNTNLHFIKFIQVTRHTN